MIIGRINQIAFYNHFPGVLHHTNAKISILPIALPGSTGVSGIYTKLTVDRPYCGQCIRAPTGYQSNMLRRIVTKGPEPEKETASLVPPRRPAT